MRIADILICIMIICTAHVLLCGLVSANDKITQRLHNAIEVSDQTAVFKVWIYFTDKDDKPGSFVRAAASMTERAMERRKTIPIDWYDLPVKDEYIRGIIDIGGIDIRASRWLNAASARLTGGQITSLSSMSFVGKIDAVAVARRRLQIGTPTIDKSLLFDSTAYGPSLTQNRMLRIDSLHTLGLNGAGVLIAFFDTGFLTGHSAFDSITITGTWDFIHDDPVVDDEVSIQQTEHGTATLSVCGGFETDSLIGPAYRADYFLAKTEILANEIRVEEDYWVLAAEWSDSIGVDIISSSLGYLDWYTYSDMDGNTAVTTIAADIAASRNILVVVSAGNEGQSPWKYITAPADGDSVVAVGAVTAAETIWNKSSFGPTSDFRIKPEVVAMGFITRCAKDIGGYTYLTGTSLSAPLISGLAALIIQANPGLRGRPMEIRRRLIESADRYDNHDERYGYGLPDGLIAAGYGLRILPIPVVNVSVNRDTTVIFKTLAPLGEMVSFEVCDLPFGAEFNDLGDGSATLWYRGDAMLEGPREYCIMAVTGAYRDTLFFTINTTAVSTPFYVGPNPFSDSLVFYFNRSMTAGCKIEVFTVAGELVYCAHSPANPFTWNGANARGGKVASGVYIIRFSVDGIEERVKVLKL